MAKSKGPAFRNCLAKVGKVWHFRFKIGKKPQHGSTFCQDKESAVIWLKAHRDSLNLKTVGISADPAYTLKETLDEWVKTHRRTRAKSYVDGVESVIRLHCVPLHDVPLRAITTRAVEGVISAYPGNAGGVAYLLRYLRRLCFWGGLERLPYKVKGPTIQENPKPWLDQSQMGLFLKELGNVVRIQRAGPSNDVVEMCRFILGLGLREDEVLTARVEWLDRVRWRYTPGKTKSGKARELMVPDHLREELDTRCEGKGPGLLFPGRFGQKRKRAYLLPFVQMAGDRMGLHGLTPHRLRVSWATMMHERGASLAVIQRALGHVSVKTTMLYVKASWVGLEAASVGLGEVMQNGFSALSGVTEREPRVPAGATIN